MIGRAFDVRKTLAKMNYQFLERDQQGRRLRIHSRNFPLDDDLVVLCLGCGRGGAGCGGFPMRV